MCNASNPPGQLFMSTYKRLVAPLPVCSSREQHRHCSATSVDVEVACCIDCDLLGHNIGPANQAPTDPSCVKIGAYLTGAGLPLTLSACTC